MAEDPEHFLHWAQCHYDPRTFKLEALFREWCMGSICPASGKILKQTTCMGMF